MLGNIFDIQRFCVHDGPGIRTTVFVNGCPLRCQWCYNPESQKKELSVAYYDGKCIACGACANACEHKCHVFESADDPSFDRPNHKIDREKCIQCGTCSRTCPTGAIELLGRKISVEDIMCEVVRDKTFYKNSGGGMTVSGGEPLMQGEFLLALLKSTKEQGIRTCIETCGSAPYFCGFVEVCQLVEFVSKLRLFFGIVFLFYRYIFRDVGKNVIDTRR